MPTITPFLWFDDDLDDAIAFYAMVFADAVVQGTVPGPDGKTLAADFEIGGQAVKAINGGPQFPQTEAFSFFVECDGQAEVDRYWAALTADGGEEGRCGWLKDRFGVSWQVIPTQFGEMMGNGTPEQSQRVMAAMMQMQKFDVATLQAAYDG